MRLTLLTVTGARPQAWELCRRWMAAQDYTGPVHWIIVDDGPVEMPQATPPQSNWACTHVYPRPAWKPGRNTQNRNMRAAMEYVNSDDALVIIEDDDYYAPGYLTAIAAELKTAELVGQGLSRKYNLLTRRAKERFYDHRASLCCTAMRGSALQTFRRVLQISPKLSDIPLWTAHKDAQTFDGAYVVSLKCLPGRSGIDSGHQARFGDIADPKGDLLRSWVGDSAAAPYDRIINDMNEQRRESEIQLYVQAYKSPDYKMGVRRKHDVQRILADLPPGSYLDVSTGRGEALAMAEAAGLGPVAGTEVVPGLLQPGRVHYSKAHALPFDDGSYDHVSCFDVLEHLTELDIRPALREMYRVAKVSVTVSASETPSIYRGRDLHISRRPKAQWLGIIRECWGPGAVCIGTAGRSPAFQVRK